MAAPSGFVDAEQILWDMFLCLNIAESSKAPETMQRRRFMQFARETRLVKQASGGGGGGGGGPGGAVAAASRARGLMEAEVNMLHKAESSRQAEHKFAFSCFKAALLKIAGKMYGAGGAGADARGPDPAAAPPMTPLQKLMARHILPVAFRDERRLAAAAALGARVRGSVPTGGGPARRSSASHLGSSGGADGHLSLHREWASVAREMSNVAPFLATGVGAGHHHWDVTGAGAGGRGSEEDSSDDDGGGGGDGAAANRHGAFDPALRLIFRSAAQAATPAERARGRHAPRADLSQMSQSLSLEGWLRLSSVFGLLPGSTASGSSSFAFSHAEATWLFYDTARLSARVQGRGFVDAVGGLSYEELGELLLRAALLHARKTAAAERAAASLEAGAVGGGVGPGSYARRMSSLQSGSGGGGNGPGSPALGGGIISSSRRGSITTGVSGVDLADDDHNSPAEKLVALFKLMRAECLQSIGAQGQLHSAGMAAAEAERARGHIERRTSAVANGNAGLAGSSTSQSLLSRGAKLFATATDAPAVAALLGAARLDWGHALAARAPAAAAANGAAAAGDVEEVDDLTAAFFRQEIDTLLTRHASPRRRLQVAAGLGATGAAHLPALLSSLERELNASSSRRAPGSARRRQSVMTGAPASAAGAGGGGGGGGAAAAGAEFGARGGGAASSRAIRDFLGGSGDAGASGDVGAWVAEGGDGFLMSPHVVAEAEAATAAQAKGYDGERVVRRAVAQAAADGEAELKRAVAAAVAAKDEERARLVAAVQRQKDVEMRLAVAEVERRAEEDKAAAIASSEAASAQWKAARETYASTHAEAEALAQDALERKRRTLAAESARYDQETQAELKVTDAAHALLVWRAFPSLAVCVLACLPSFVCLSLLWSRRGNWRLINSASSKWSAPWRRKRLTLLWRRQPPSLRRALPGPARNRWPRSRIIGGRLRRATNLHFRACLRRAISRTMPLGHRLCRAALRQAGTQVMWGTPRPHPHRRHRRPHRRRRPEPPIWGTCSPRSEVAWAYAGRRRTGERASYHPAANRW